MVNVLVIATRAIGMGIQSGYVRIIISFLNRCYHMRRKSGIKFLVLYLKACYILMTQAMARTSPLDTAPLGARVGRGRGHLPSVIPVLHRIRIMDGDVFVIRLWATLFSIYRVFEFPGTFKLATITEYFYLDPILTYEFSEFIRKSFILNLRTIFGTDWLWEIFEDPISSWKQLVVRPFIISTTSSSVGSHLSTSPVGIISAFRAWGLNPELLPVLRDWLKFTGNIRFLNWFNTGFDFCTTQDSHRKYVNFSLVNARAQLGRIGLKDEPAGKIRTFALVDCFTQWVLSPLHDKIFEILRMIPQDGTFDQLKPLDLIHKLGLKGTSLFSFDLSAATDRLPLTLQGVIMSSLIGAHGANMWMTLLVARIYSLPARAVEELGLSKGAGVHYVVGQPMGARTSWAILALTHHAIIQFAALRAGVVGVNEWFKHYAVLGDDVVIANDLVAREYLVFMKQIGVGVNPSKSVIADQGFSIFEFAKRVFGAGVNLSPIPLLEVVASKLNLAAWLEFVKKHQMSLTQGLIFLGYKYKSVSTITKNFDQLPRRLQTCLLTWTGPGGPGFKSFIHYFQLRSMDFITPIDDEKLQSFVLGIRDSLLQRLEDLRPRIKAVHDIITVDRTRVHYGTELPREGFLPTFEISGPLTSNEVVWLRTLMEYCYRDYYLDVGSRYRELISLAELLTITSSPELLEDILQKLSILEADVGSLILQAKESRADPVPASRQLWKMFRSNSWARRWRSLH